VIIRDVPAIRPGGSVGESTLLEGELGQ